MKTDKELLMLAAKAAGYDTSHPMNTDRCELAVTIDDLWVTCDGNLVSTGWNPLKDDGHALRLAVKLQFDVITKWGDNCVCIIGGDDHFEEPQQPDTYAATRRAIVRAAAAIGEKL